MGRRAETAVFRRQMFTGGVNGPSPGHGWLCGVDMATDWRASEDSDLRMSEPWWGGPDLDMRGAANRSILLYPATPCSHASLHCLLLLILVAPADAAPDTMLPSGLRP